MFTRDFCVAARFEDCFTMRRLQGRGFKPWNGYGTKRARIGDSDSFTPAPPQHAALIVTEPALDQVGLRCRRAWMSAHLLIAGVESEAGEESSEDLHRVPGAMQHAALRGVMLRRTGTVTAPRPASRLCGARPKSAAPRPGHGLIAFWRRAAGSPGSRTGWPPGRPCRAGSGSSTGTAPGCACRRSARTRLRCCAGRRDI